jgi:membrane-associated protease RseP (regulator of RpoE activity)
MPRATPSIFISYRREDCPGHAGRLFDHLRARFGAESVFMDVTDIEAGVDFTDVLQRAVGSCDVLLAVVGREWLTCTDRNGQRRLDDPNDFIRLEIGIALTRDVRVIPVIVEGAAMPGASDLPPDLAALAKRQAVELRDARWIADVDNLADVLDRALSPKTAAIESSPSRSRPRRAGLWGLVAAALVAALVGVVTLVPRTDPTASAPPQSAPAPPAGDRSAPVEPQPAADAAPPPEVKQVPPPQSSPEREARIDVAPQSPPPSTRPANGFLGVRMTDPPPDARGAVTRGAIVQSLATGGPAANAGIRAGDLIVEYGGAPVNDAAGFNRQTAASAPGDAVEIRLRRGGLVRTLQVVVGDRANAPGSMGTVVIHYAAAEDEKYARELAAALRETIGDARYAIRTFMTPRFSGGGGQVRYSTTRLSAMAESVAQGAESSLSRMYGRGVAFAPVLDDRVTASSLIVVMPGRTPAPAASLPDPVITVAYEAPEDERTAEALANFLRTLRSGWKYSVRTQRKSAGDRTGQIDRMGELAQVLARDPAAWLSRAYGRRIVLQPAKGEKIGRDAVMLWMPSR